MARTGPASSTSTRSGFPAPDEKSPQRRVPGRALSTIRSSDENLPSPLASKARAWMKPEPLPPTWACTTPVVTTTASPSRFALTGCAGAGPAAVLPP